MAEVEMVKLTTTEKIRGCQGCFFWNPKARDTCQYRDKLEFGKYGKCLKKRKPKW
jgi:multimeric flavodoxin WrbA